MVCRRGWTREVAKVAARRVAACWPTSRCPGGMVKLIPQTVSFKDGQNIIEFQWREDGLFDFELNLTNTYNDGMNDPENHCELGGRGASQVSGTQAVEDLFEQINPSLGPLEAHSFFVTIDKESTPATGGFHIGWRYDINDVPYSLKLWPVNRSPATVSMIGNISDGLTVDFTGGDIRLKNWSGKAKDKFHLICPMNPLDVIMMVLVAQP